MDLVRDHDLELTRDHLGHLGNDGGCFWGWCEESNFVLGLGLSVGMGDPGVGAGVMDRWKNVLDDPVPEQIGHGHCGVLDKPEKV